MSKQARKPETSRLIASNKKSRHDYTIEDQFEAGLVLEGWEIKSLRAGQIQLRDSYVVLKKGEAWIIGSHIAPLSTVSTHITPDPQRSRKLLLNQRELAKLRRGVEREGYTVVALDVHWKKNMAKLQIALAKGKKTHDKRQAAKQKDWNREKQRLLKPK